MHRGREGSPCNARAMVARISVASLGLVRPSSPHEQRRSGTSSSRESRKRGNRMDARAPLGLKARGETQRFVAAVQSLRGRVAPSQRHRALAHRVASEPRRHARADLLHRTARRLRGQYVRDPGELLLLVNNGQTWTTPQKLSDPMQLGWLAPTTQGVMVGDYISTAATFPRPSVSRGAA